MRRGAPHSRQQPGDQGLCNSDVHGGWGSRRCSIAAIHVIVGWAPTGISPITSLAFILVEVPLPVWKMSIGNSLSYRPSHDLFCGLDRFRQSCRR